MATTTAQEARETLLGAWQLVSWQEIRPSGTVAYPLGPHAAGRLMYDRSGQMSAQFVRSHRRFASDDWRQAQPGEMAGAWPDYFGYYGTFHVDPRSSVLVHRIEGSWFPNLVGTEQVRHYHLNGNRLDLAAETARAKVRVVWERLD